MPGFLATALAVACAAPVLDGTAAKLADAYADAVEKLNAEHARKPGTETEAELAARLPKKALQALDELVRMAPDADVGAALARCGESALELDRLDDFDRVRARLSELEPERAQSLG